MKLIVGFSRGNTWFSKLICFCTNSSVSHSYVRLQMFDEVDVVCQASDLYVNVKSYELVKQNHTIIEEYETDIEIAHNKPLLNKIFSEMGKPYSFLELIGFLWVLFCKKIHVITKNPFSDSSKAYVCSEYVAHILDIDNVDESLTPEDLRKICAQKYKRIT